MDAERKPEELEIGMAGRNGRPQGGPRGMHRF